MHFVLFFLSVFGLSNTRLEEKSAAHTTHKLLHKCFVSFFTWHFAYDYLRQCMHSMDTFLAANQKFNWIAERSAATTTTIKRHKMRQNNYFLLVSNIHCFKSPFFLNEWKKVWIFLTFWCPFVVERNIGTHFYCAHKKRDSWSFHIWNMCLYACFL